MELVKNRKTKEPLVPYGGSHPALVKTVKFLKEKGLYMFAAQNVLFVNPPFVITEVGI
jgi:taurine---2-oxoglutarate transaminase